MTPPLVLPSLSDDERAALLARLERSIDRSAGPDACHPWTGTEQHGYGLLHVYVGGKRRLLKAHRLVYEFETGAAAVTVDHTCHSHETCPGGDTCPHRRCCNPAHLTDLSLADNARRAQRGRRREMCRAGLHPMTGENVHESPDGRLRSCRACAAARAREARAANPSGRERQATYRPRGMNRAQLVAWGLSPNDDADGCWYWEGRPSLGYTTVKVGGKGIHVHRLVHEVIIGPVPSGYHVDHVCHDPKVCRETARCPHRACVNPAHLEAVPGPVNNGAGRSANAEPREVCRAGLHALSEENVYVTRAGVRMCAACYLAKQRSRRKEARKGRRDLRYRKDAAVCRKGHDLREHGFEVEGRVRCRACARQRNREYKQRVSD